MTADDSLAAAVLTIDLDALAANYRLLRQRAAPAECAAVVKADAYGLGLAAAAPALARAGARTFFVAQPGEAVALRALLPEATIGVLNGLLAGQEDAFLAARLAPVLNDLGQVERWKARATAEGRPLPAFLHVDTGMNRLGLEPAELDRLAAEPDRLEGLEIRAYLSHLACADEPGHPLTPLQLTRFRGALARLPRRPASLANSAGIFCGPAYHFDLVRPGSALYGINPTPGRDNPMAQTIRLDARILQVRDVDSPMTVGYGATHAVKGRGKIATIAVGYADGYLRSLSNRGHVWIAGRAAPLVGRVSMDLITVDVSDLPSGLARPGQTAELIGPHCPPDALAGLAGTIGYEVLTALGRRYARRHVGGGA